MQGTLRTFDRAMRDDIVARIRRTAEGIAAAGGATAGLSIHAPTYPVTIIDPELTARVLSSLQRVVGDENVTVGTLHAGAEDFSFYAQKVPGFFFRVGVMLSDQDPVAVSTNHSSWFYVDEEGFATGLRVMF